MQIDPHTIQQILQRIQNQMRCPQCGKRVPVDFSSVRVVGETAIILQLQCEVCNAYIVLQASLANGEHFDLEGEGDKRVNASSRLELSEDEMSMMHAALEESGGSFEGLFKEYGSSVSQQEETEPEEPEEIDS